MIRLYGEWFNGHEASEYAKQHGYLDYATLAEGFDAVYNGEIIFEEGWECESGNLDNDVFQWYIISPSFAEVLEDIDEIVFYNQRLDMYLWGVTHYGTSWSYVLTNIPLNQGDKAFE